MRVRVFYKLVVTLPDSPRCLTVLILRVISASVHACVEFDRVDHCTDPFACLQAIVLTDVTSSLGRTRVEFDKVALLFSAPSSGFWLVGIMSSTRF